MNSKETKLTTKEIVKNFAQSEDGINIQKEIEEANQRTEYGNTIYNVIYDMLKGIGFFQGRILNLNFSGKCVFFNDFTSEYLVIPYMYIESIIPTKKKYVSLNEGIE